ncbi:hypothetical protein [Leptolyngbya sp. NIES-2104]|uniref:hypothetical protein n=1 Tax=Leptolyngbya sp. NIES-2104 TaxID=1552121 RepID=UPI0006EC8FD5|nr:hypothetical protein [Leptolyngbya sp. NIES-2104]GAP98429.1 hypothetical protein NIES2104_49840 [Leptolyngbya sp. NIES-2104]
MQVFFIHGVATKDAAYSKRLQTLLKEEFSNRDKQLPYFYGSFWGTVVNEKGRLWNWVHQDLKELKKNYPHLDTKDVFRYQEFREDFISDFFGDVLTYFNTERGRDVRGIIAEQLRKFLQHLPQDEELHIIAHSLGTVVLWDVLFSDRFSEGDPAHTIRELIQVPDASVNTSRMRLKSITTMGSPVLFFNMMLDVQPEKVKAFASQYQPSELRWINIIHASDIIAYPLQSAMNARLMPNFFFRDKYIWADRNGAEKAARTFGQAHAAMGVGLADAHSSYWTSRGAARLITANLLDDRGEIDSAKVDTE